MSGPTPKTFQIPANTNDHWADIFVALDIQIRPAFQQKASNLRMKRQQRPHPMLIHRIRISPFANELLDSC
jgi:hypothetical protein